MTFVPRSVSAITSFTGEFEFLSNFFIVQIEYEGMGFFSVEHAYQAAKTDELAEKLLIQRCTTPGRAKKLGRRLHLRPDWEQVKLQVMEELLRKKFSHPYLRYDLLSTRDTLLVEGNWWGDRFWGMVNGVGENHLGKLLMKIREEIQSGKQ